MMKIKKMIYNMNRLTKRKKYGGMRHQFYPQQNERLREQTRRETEFNDMASKRFEELESNRLGDDDMNELYNSMGNIDINPDDTSSDEGEDFEDALMDEISDDDINPDDTSSDEEEDFEDALMAQPTIKNKIILDRNPRRVVVRLDEHLCQILPFKCTKFFKTFYYTFVMEYDGLSLRIIDIVDDDNNSIYDSYKTIIHRNIRNIDSREDFIKYTNRVFFNLDEIDINIRNNIEDGMVYGLNNLLVLETIDNIDTILGGPITIMLDFNEIVYNNNRLPDILYPEITIYRCPRNIDNKIKCNGTDDCSTNCRHNY